MESDDGDKPSRPSSLDLYNPNQTPVATRKPRFNFSLAHNAYELNNLDPEVLDAPNLTYNLGKSTFYNFFYGNISEYVILTYPYKKINQTSSDFHFIKQKIITHNK